MAKMINAVCGPVSSDEIGTTLMHEHIQFGYAGWYANTVSRYDRKGVLSTTLKAMADIQACGVRTYVDATPNDSGRDPELYREISERSGVNIVCSTGLYNEAQGASPYFQFWGGIVDGGTLIENLFTTEIEAGIGDTGIKAGAIKVASGTGAITDYEKMVFTAAARTQKKTGVPILTHTEAGMLGDAQADLLIAEGANPAQIMIGHSGGSGDLKYHLKTLEKGVFLAFDRLGLDADLWSAGPDSLRISVILGLLEQGYANQLILSHDVVLNWLGGDLDLPAEIAGNWYPTHLFKNIVPALKKAGVSDDEIHAITVENPRKIFEG